MPRRLPGEIAYTLGAYVTGQLKISFVLVLVYATGFAIAGMPWWLLVAVLCGALHLIPVFGSVIGLAIAELVMISSEQDLYRCLGVLAVWVICEGLETFWLTPRILGKRLQLSPLMMFFVVMAGGSLFGFVGVLLAAPVAAVVAVIYRALIRRRAGI